VEHADDAGRPLVAGSLQPVALDDAGLGGCPDEVDGAMVDDVGEQRTERDDQIGADLAGDAGDLLGEGAPPQLRLGAQQEHDVTCGRRRREHVVARPEDLPGHPVGQADLGTGALEVEELLRIDGGEGAC
jgi:hypothetical protein